MFKKILTFTGLLFSLLLMVNSSWAAEVSFLNSNFERLRGTSIPYEAQFFAEAGTGTLTLSNGTAEGAYRVSAATVYLNGDAIIESGEMNQNVSYIELNVPLQENNTLVVQLVSAPESFIGIDITQEVLAEAADFVGAEGANVEVVDSSSPLEGVSLEIPPGALAEPALISIVAAEALPEVPVRGAFAGEVLELKPEGLTFDAPVTLTLPYNDVNNDGIIDGTSIDEQFVSAGFFNEETGLWEKLKVVDRDPLNNTVSAEIDFFSIYSPFVRTDNIIPQSTQSPPANIAIDGNPVEWTGLNSYGGPIKPTMSEPDPIDSTCGQDTDIRDVYTAMDSANAYIMIKMEGMVHPSAQMRLKVDIREGKDHVSDSYADLDLFLREGGVHAENLSGDIGFDHSTYEGVTVARGDVLEARIPLELFRSTVTGLLPAYFNVTMINVRKPEAPGTVCDVDEMYPKIPWFKFQKRIFADKTDRVTLIFGKITREGKFLNDYGDIDNIVITRPDGTEIKLTGADLFVFPQTSAWGRYVSDFDTFVYDDYLNETYFLKNYLKENDSYVEVLQKGRYIFKLIDKNGDIYEDEFNVTRTEDIATVDSDTVQCHTISNGDLRCDWVSPAYIGNPDFLDVEETMQAHPHLRAYQGQNRLRYIYPTAGTVWGELGNFVIVPAADLSKLVEGADKLTISVRTRVRSGGVRSYSAEKDISLEAGLGL